MSHPGDMAAGLANLLAAAVHRDLTASQQITATVCRLFSSLQQKQGWILLALQIAHDVEAGLAYLHPAVVHSNSNSAGHKTCIGSYCYVTNHLLDSSGCRLRMMWRRDWHTCTLPWCTGT